MRLFFVNDQYEVELNREWILMVPEFQALVRRDKGSRGDYRGDKKLRAKKELAYIYYCLDFTSPLREWEKEERHMEALRYVGLEATDIDDEVMIAYNYYQELLLVTAPSLKTLQSIKKGRAKLNEYFENVDFEKKDKLGKAFYTPKEYMENISRLNMMDKAIRDYEKQVEEELKADTGIRGKGKLGGKEGRRQGTIWQEGSAPEGDADSVSTELKSAFGEEDEETEE